MSVPKEFIELAEKVCELAKEAGLDSFQGKFRPGFGSEFNEEISLSWSTGRHGANSSNIHLAYNQNVFINITKENKDG